MLEVVRQGIRVDLLLEQTLCAPKKDGVMTKNVFARNYRAGEAVFMRMKPTTRPFSILHEYSTSLELTFGACESVTEPKHRFDFFLKESVAEKETEESMTKF